MPVQCGGDDQTILALGGTELDFGQAGGVGVVYHDDRAAAGFGEHFSNVPANPDWSRLAMKSSFWPA